MKEWIKYGIIFFLGMTVVYQYLSLRQAASVVQMLQADVQAHISAINNQCVQLLGRQGFQVIKTPPPEPEVEEPEEEEEEKGDVER